MPVPPPRPEGTTGDEADEDEVWEDYPTTPAELPNGNDASEPYASTSRLTLEGEEQREVADDEDGEEGEESTEHE